MNDKEDKKSNNGCFIVTFLFIASGIPIALKNEENVKFFGIIPIVILGLIVAYAIAKALTKDD